MHPRVGQQPVVANSDGTLGHWVVECMKRGSKLIVVDPKLTWLAGKADVWLQVRPGTDTALVLALCNIIIENDLQDKEFIDLWCYGYNEFAENVKKYPASFAAKTCGVDEDLVVEAALEIGMRNPHACNGALRWTTHQRDSLQAWRASILWLLRVTLRSLARWLPQILCGT